MNYILPEKDIDSILRNVRINKLDLLKNESLRNKFDLLLITFEKECKKLKKTQTNKSKPGIFYVCKKKNRFALYIFIVYLYI